MIYSTRALAFFAGLLMSLTFISLGTAHADEQPELYRHAERAKDLVVWITGDSGEGAAVIFDVQGTVIHAMTAKHVVWRGGPLNDLQAKFRQWPGRSFEAQPDRYHHDRDFAALKVDLASLGLSEAEIRRALPLDILGDPSKLDPGTGTYPVGHSSVDNWLSPESPALFNSFDTSRAKDRTKDVLRVEQTCPPGHSGGALFDDQWRLIGVIFENGQNYCRAWRIDWALATTQRWKYGASLTPAPAKGGGVTRPEQITVAIMGLDNRSTAPLPTVDAAARDVISSYLVDLPRVVLVTRDRLQSIRSEMARAGTQRSEEELAGFGRLLHADALVTGSVLRYDVERRSFKGHGAQATVDVYRMDISLAILDVETGRITYSQVYDVEDKRTSYPQSGGQSGTYGRPVDRSAELLKRLLDKAVGDLRDGLSKLALGLPAAGQMIAVSITSDPPGADVIVGGLHVGSTPLTHELQLGIQEVEIDRPGHSHWLHRVKVEPGLRIHANLQKLR